MAVFAALAGNALLAMLKGISAAATGSAAMLAETFHSVADTGNEALLFLGMRLARRPPDEIHPFGHGKNTYFWAFVVSVMLFTLGGGFSIWEAVGKIRAGPGHLSGGWAYAVLAASFLFESLSFTVAMRSFARARRGRPLREFWREARDPTLVTVLFEDAAALTSLMIAAAGLALAELTGSSMWDAAASALIGVLLIAVALVLAFESHSLLIGERAPLDIERAIRDAVAADPEVAAVVGLRTMHVGPREIIAMLGVELRNDPGPSGVAEIIDRLHGRVDRSLDRRIKAPFVVIEPRRAR